jgi:hypothetical protein
MQSTMVQNPSRTRCCWDRSYWLGWIGIAAAWAQHAASPVAKAPEAKAHPGIEHSERERQGDGRSPLVTEPAGALGASMMPACEPGTLPWPP